MSAKVCKCVSDGTDVFFFCLIILIRELLLVFITHTDVVTFYVSSYEHPSQKHVPSWHIITAHVRAILSLIFCLGSERLIVS